MIRVVSWNVANRSEPWHWLAKMAKRGEADVALLQEAGSPPDDLRHLVCYENDNHWDHSFFDRWPLVVKLSDRVEVEWFRNVPPWSELGEREIGASGIGTMAAARVVPCDRPQDAFIAVSMYARWMQAHPLTGSNQRIHAEPSVHRILSDLSAFITYVNPRRHRILAAGDLNMWYRTTDYDQGLNRLDRIVWDRFDALGLEFLGPQVSNGRPMPEPAKPVGTKNVPTYYTRAQSPEEASGQLDYAFASRGFHERVKVRALNSVEEWGPSDHCRLLIGVSTD